MPISIAKYLIINKDMSGRSASWAEIAMQLQEMGIPGALCKKCAPTISNVDTITR